MNFTNLLTGLFWTQKVYLAICILHSKLFRNKSTLTEPNMLLCKIQAYFLSIYIWKNSWTTVSGNWFLRLAKWRLNSFFIHGNPLKTHPSNLNTLLSKRLEKLLLSRKRVVWAAACWKKRNNWFSSYWKKIIWPSDCRTRIHTYLPWTHLFFWRRRK